MDGLYFLLACVVLVSPIVAIFWVILCVQAWILAELVMEWGIYNGAYRVGGGMCGRTNTTYDQS